MELYIFISIIVSIWMIAVSIKFYNTCCHIDKFVEFYITNNKETAINKETTTNKETDNQELVNKNTADSDSNKFDFGIFSTILLIGALLTILIILSNT